MTAMRVCALIAAFNEAPHVAEVVAGVRRSIGDVLVVDDGSTDGTAEAARRAGAEVVSHDRNLGKGQAVRTGLAYLQRRPCTHVVLLDADLQHDPGEIPHLLDAARRGADLVLAERDFDRQAMPAARYYSNVIGSRILSWFVGAPIRDSQSGYRVVRLDLLRHTTLTARGYEIETEMLIKLMRAGARLERVPVRRLRYAGVRSHIRPFRDTFRTCMLALRYRFLDGVRS